MKRQLKRFAAALCAAILLISAMPAARAESYTPKYTTVRVGLYYNSTALDAANLENVSGYGSGYRLGYFDENRDFVSLGIDTAETQISMLRDINMYYDHDLGRYYAGTYGDTVVGCYHIQLDAAYTSYAAAKSAASKLGYSDTYIKYSDGYFYVCIGNYTSEEAASKADAALGISLSHSITSGTSYTVAVVVTGTNRILLEFEYGTERWLAVRPQSINGEKTQTWFKGYKYYGSFEYKRLSGGSMTVVNFVNIEDYVKGVLPYEMSSSWPVEALKAQALSARTYAVANFNAHTGFDVCCTDCCQVYHGINASGTNSDIATEQTAGQYILYHGELATTYFFSCDGGATENSENVWSAALGYLKGIPDPYESAIAGSVAGYSWTKTYTNESLTSRLQGLGYVIGDIVDFQITERTAMGNVYKVTCTDSNGRTLTFTKDRVRTVLGLSSIRFNLNATLGETVSTKPQIYVNDANTALSGDLSSYYAIGGSGVASALPDKDVRAISGSGTVGPVGGSVSSGGGAQLNVEPGTYKLLGAGMGHNVGMSQWGAYAMAKYYDKTYDEILRFYFTDITIANK